MKKSEVIARLSAIPGDPDVKIEIVEPYDDDAATLREDVTEVTTRRVKEFGKRRQIILLH